MKFGQVPVQGPDEELELLDELLELLDELELLLLDELELLLDEDDELELLDDELDVQQHGPITTNPASPRLSTNIP